MPRRRLHVDEQLLLSPFGIATNHAGGAGMNLEIFVQPETVSFSGIAMAVQGVMVTQEELNEVFGNN